MMKRTIWTLILFSFFSIELSAQELPMPSPNSTFSQRVGLTDITVRYSRPSMKERMIFGELVPHEELWRAGANMCTRISFSNNVKFGDKEVKAGTYSLFFIPSMGEWTFILNSDTTLRGTSGYDSLNDVLRTKALPMPNPEMRETMLFNIDMIRNESATLVMEWADMSVRIPFTVNDREQAMKNIKTAIKEQKEGEYRAYMRAASYMNDIGENEKALDHIDKAIEIGDYWYAHWIRAQILADLERYADATEAGDAALQKGQSYYADQEKEFPYLDMIAPKLGQWRNK
jgi:hypothetical protein